MPGRGARAALLVAAAAPAAQTWYYCEQARGCYPYVRECPGGWKPVPATPPR
ncbi:MAG: hypothetical protein M0015_10605 [Betaproteobacteria bacterium]|nr:hypothetical protein [Betaproteobacteria bacterium]